MKGEGIFSLARAFAAAGIPSLWKIDDQTNYQITELFHIYVSQCLPMDKAIQQAKIDFMDNRDTFDKLPYFWGATVLVGPALSFKTTDLLWVWFCLGILVLGSSIGLIWWRYN